MTGLAGRLLAGAAAFLLFLAAAPLAALAQAPAPVPKLSGRVVDLTGTLAAADRQAIAAKLAAFEQAKGSQVAVLVVPSLGDETIEEFATRVTDAWQLGRAGVDDGVLFVVAMQERRLRIQTGRGVQGTLTDALSKRIIAELVTPRFRAGDFPGGIQVGVDAIIKAIEGEALPAPPAAKAKGGGSTSGADFLWLALMAVPVAGMFLRAVLGRLLGATLTGGATGLAAWLFFGSLLAGGVIAFIAFLVVLFMGMPGAGVHRGGGGGWSGGGWSGGGGGGWSGGGGFSGGGGGFDGGGASGGW
ncbi:MAG TPA: TPM domain-containing protein [Usitatibacteraceae bacterium]|nr:TPM domain-containing protein [Usitatibacteraceae bacterium]HQY46126.1 TPM domain-containing protein [Usitatibacteraceae bacterium]